MITTVAQLEALPIGTQLHSPVDSPLLRTPLVHAVRQADGWRVSGITGAVSDARLLYFARRWQRT